MQLEGLINSKTFAVEVQEALRQDILELEMQKQTRQTLGGHKSAAITVEKKKMFRVLSDVLGSLMQFEVRT